MPLFDPVTACPSVRTLMRVLNLDGLTAQRVRSILKTGDEQLDRVVRGKAPPYPATSVDAAFKRYPGTWKWARSCFKFPSLDEVRLHMLDDTIGTHGIEGWAIGIYDGVSYCNTGEMYAWTLALTPDGWFLGSLEDLARRWPEVE